MQGKNIFVLALLAGLAATPATAQRHRTDEDTSRTNGQRQVDRAERRAEQQQQRAERQQQRQEQRQEQHQELRADRSVAPHTLDRGGDQQRAGTWLRHYKDVPPAQQERALQSDSQFRSLAPEGQQRL